MDVVTLRSRFDGEDLEVRMKRLENLKIREDWWTKGEAEG
jgi:hypothetical protein